MKKKFKGINLILVFILTLCISVSMIGCSKKGDKLTEEKESFENFYSWL